jgi:hypothetical protein
MKSMLVGLALILLCQVAAAEEPKVTLKVKDTPLLAVAKEIAKQSKLAVVVDPEQAKAKITVTLEGVPARKALARVATLAHTQVVRLASSAVWIGRSLEVWEKRIQATLVLTTLRVNFKDKHLTKAFEFIKFETDVPIALDPEVKRTRESDTLVLTLKVEKVRGRELLDLMAQSLDLAWDVRYGVVFVSTRKRLASLPRLGMDPARDGRMKDWEAILRRRLSAERVFIDFRGSSPESALRYLSKTRSVPIVIEDDIKTALKEAAMVIQKVEDISLQQALDLVLVPRGFKYVPTKEGVKVLRKP